MANWGWQKVYHPDYAEGAIAKFQSQIEAGEAWEDVFPLRGKDGKYRWFLSQAIPIRDEPGEELLWFGTHTDITDRLQAEQERERLLEREQAARQEAETANRIKDEFLAVLSHELRSPLNPILGWAKLLQAQVFDPEKTRQALETIERNAMLQAQLIEDLLDVSRILRGKLSLNIAPVSLESAIEAALETVRLAAEAKDIRLQAQLDRRIGLVMGDVTRLQQIVWNLLSNAVKFTPSGGTVTIQLTQTPWQAADGPAAAQTWAQISVIDTGKGIDPEFLPYVFEYFRQEDSTTTRRFGGLGLGLAIVRHLTELHGGSVQVESPGDELGTTFIVRLPVFTRTKTPEPQAENTALNPQPLMLHGALTGLNILVVDDEPDVRELVSFVLKRAGARVSTAASASATLRQMEQSLPDVLVCDIGMPEQDGYMLIRQIRGLSPQQGGQIPAIALTAYAGSVNQQQAIAAGFQLHLAKPVEPETLVRAIAALVRQA
jgi:signal transduction histidine kinase/ActR/RegA family two-component response regulator